MLARGYRHAIKTVRRRRNLTQAKSAKKVGMDPKLWSKYESGKATITDAALAKVCRALECTVTELWILAQPYQRSHHNAQMTELREHAPKFGTMPAAIDDVQRILGLNEKLLPADEQHWFKVERDDLATLLTKVSGMAETMVEKYLFLIGKGRRAQDEEDDRNRT